MATLESRTQAWWEFKAQHHADCKFGFGHTIYLGVHAATVDEARRDIVFLWPDHDVELEVPAGIWPSESPAMLRPCGNCGLYVAWTALTSVGNCPDCLN